MSSSGNGNLQVYIPQEGTIIYFSHTKVAIKKNDGQLYLFEIKISYNDNKYKIEPIFIRLETLESSNIEARFLDSIDEVSTFLKAISDIFEPFEYKILIFDQKYEDIIEDKHTNLWRINDE